MKKLLKKIIAPLLSCVLTLSPLTALADGVEGRAPSAEEVIYAALSPDGTPRSAYAVVILNVSKAGSVHYYGDYTGVKNLTDTGAISYADGELTAQAEDGRFYCQGDLADADLPWNVAVTYTLDGREIGPDDLAGAAGSLAINIKTTQNQGVDARFFAHYLLQVTVTLDTGLCRNIAAEGATPANSGSDKLITFAVLPGKVGDMTVTADVQNFEMDGITLSAVPYSMDSSLGDISGLTDGVSELVEAIAQVSDGAAQLSDGASDLSVGASQLKKGTASFGSGLSQAAAGSDDLVSASAQILSALQQLNGGLSGQSGGVDLSAAAQLPAALGQLADALDQISAGIDALSGGFTAANAAMTSAVAAIPAASISQTDLAALSAANPGNAALAALIENYTAAQTVSGTWKQVSSAFSAVDTTLPGLKTSVSTVSASLRGMASQLTAAIQSSDALAGLTALIQGLASLSENYAAFHQGLVSYTGGVETLAGGWPALQSGISDLSSGAYSLAKGSLALSDGTAALDAETRTIPERVDALTDSLDFSGFEPASFISALNTNTDSVQFVIKTDSIRIPDTAASGDSGVSVSSLWDRIVALFTAK